MTDGKTGELPEGLPPTRDEVDEQAIAACGPLPLAAGTGRKVKVYAFRLHGSPAGDIQPIKGTRESIAKLMRGEPVEGTEEEVDASLLDEEGFYRERAASDASSSTS